MAFDFGFYNAVDHDRVYNAVQFGEMFDGLINDGIYATIGQAFSVRPGGGMNVIVGTGRAWFNRTWNVNSSEMSLTIDVSDLLLPRYDAVILEVDKRLSSRTNSIKVLKGTPATTPVLPTLTYDDGAGLYQYLLASVYVKENAQEILKSNIENFMGRDRTPFVTGILQSINIDAAFLQWEGSFEEWFENVRTTLGDDAAGALLNQVNERVKYTDKATNQEMIDGTTNDKWVTPALVKMINSPEGKEPGDIVQSMRHLDLEYPGKYLKLNGQTISMGNYSNISDDFSVNYPETMTIDSSLLRENGMAINKGVWTNGLGIYRVLKDGSFNVNVGSFSTNANGTNIPFTVDNLIGCCADNVIKTFNIDTSEMKTYDSLKNIYPVAAYGYMHNNQRFVLVIATNQNSAGAIPTVYRLSLDTDTTTVLRNFERPSNIMKHDRWSGMAVEETEDTISFVDYYTFRVLDSGGTNLYKESYSITKNVYDKNTSNISLVEVTGSKTFTDSNFDSASILAGYIENGDVFYLSLDRSSIGSSSISGNNTYYSSTNYLGIYFKTLTFSDGTNRIKTIHDFGRIGASSSSTDHNYTGNTIAKTHGYLQYYYSFCHTKKGVLYVFVNIIYTRAEYDCNSGTCSITAVKLQGHNASTRVYGTKPSELDVSSTHKINTNYGSYVSPYSPYQTRNGHKTILKKDGFTSISSFGMSDSDQSTILIESKDGDESLAFSMAQKVSQTNTSYSLSTKLSSLYPFVNNLTMLEKLPNHFIKVSN